MQKSVSAGRGTTPDIFRMLSVDMSYFTSLLGEDPDGNAWEVEYAKYKRIANDFLLDDFNKIFSRIKNIPLLYLGIEHGSILVPFVWQHKIILTNLDRHDDRGDYSASVVHEGNWVSFLEDRERLLEYHWIKSENDLDIDWLNYQSLDSVLEQEYDCAFVCLSPFAFPPHYQDYFERFLTLSHRWAGKEYKPARYSLCHINERKLPMQGMGRSLRRTEHGLWLINGDELSLVPNDLDRVKFEYIADSYF